MQIEILLRKSFVETEFSHTKDTWLSCQGDLCEENPGAIQAVEIIGRKILARQSVECTFYGTVAIVFFYLRSTSFVWCDLANFCCGSRDDFCLIISDYASEYCKSKKKEANLNVREITLNDDVITAIEKILLSSLAS